MSNSLAFVSYEKDKFKKTKTYVLNMMNMKPSIDGVQFPVSFHINAISDIFDPKKETKRIIRYVPGEPSIYKDEQSPDDKIPKKKQTLMFVKGFLHIDPREVQMIEYIEKCNENGTNTNRMGNTKPLFYELRMDNAAKNMNDTAKKSIAATSWVYSASAQDLTNYANILGIDINRELDEIQWDLKIAAERDPVKFLQGFNDPSTRRKFDIINAIKKNIITINQNTISWTAGGTICAAPMGRAPIDYLTEFTFADTNGQNLYLAILEALRPKAEVEQVKLQSDGKDQLDILIEMAVEKGVVAKSGQWFAYGEHKYLGSKWKAFLKENTSVVSEINSKMKELA